MDQDTASASVEKANVSQAEGQDPEAVQKALEAVNKIVGSVVSLVKAKGKMDDEEDDDKGKAPPFKAKKAEEKTEEKPVEKSEEKPAEAAKEEVVKSAEDALLELGTAIQKAARLTPARIEKIKEAMETLKLVIEGVEPGTAPSTKTPDGSFGASQVKPVGTEGKPVVKSAEGDSMDRIVKALEGLGEEVKKAIGGLTERVDNIEKAKPAPAGEGDSATQKTQKSIWGGVL